MQARTRKQSAFCWRFAVPEVLSVKFEILLRKGEGMVNTMSVGVDSCEDR